MKRSDRNTKADPLCKARFSWANMAFTLEIFLSVLVPKGFSCSSQTPNRHLRMHSISARGVLGSRWGPAPKHSAGGCGMAPHARAWLNPGIQVSRSTGGMYGYNRACSSLAEGWRGLLFIYSEKITTKETKTHPNKQQKQSKNHCEPIFIFRHLNTFPQYLLRARCGLAGKYYRLSTQFISQQLCCSLTQDRL